MTQRDIAERTLEQLLRTAPALLDKQYTLKPHPETGKYAWVRGHVLTIAASDADGTLYIARQRESKTFPPHAAREVGIDSDGHPFYTLRYGDRPVAVYDDLFLHNTGFACALGQLHEKQLDRVHDLLAKGDPGGILARFDAYIDDFLARLPGLKDRIVRASYKGTLKEDLHHLPYVDRAAIGLLALKGGASFATEYDLLRDPSPGHLFRDAVTVTERQRCELFHAWYRSTIDTKAYKRKIRESEREHDAAFAHHLKSLETQLRSHGFEKVERIRGL